MTWRYDRVLKTFLWMISLSLFCMFMLSSCGKKEEDIFIYDEEDFIEEAEEEIFDDEEINTGDEEEEEEHSGGSDSEETVYGMTLYELEDKFTGGYEGTSENYSSVVIGFSTDKKEAFYAVESEDSTDIVYACGLCAIESEGAYSITDSKSLNIIRFSIAQNEGGESILTTADGQTFKVEKKGAEAVCMDFMACVLAAPE
ncbi:MAG: hypothetical protein K6G83_00180 [Lachnospiraceae bacterium]|nr:hypothetical protein [Lachnospiraceae bacterium]